MSRLTMFGRDNFIDKNMITVLKAQEKLIIDEVYKETKRTISSAGIAVTVDRAKLEKWLRFCTQLEHIDKSELIDFAVKKKFTDLEHELEVYVSKRIKTITMADLGNHVACYDCKNKDKRIAELEKELAEKEELLKNAPKYRVGQRVYISLLNSIITEIKIDECDIKYRLYDWKQWFNEDDIFATKEEAEQKLKELEGK